MCLYDVTQYCRFDLTGLVLKSLGLWSAAGFRISNILNILIPGLETAIRQASAFIGRLLTALLLCMSTTTTCRKPISWYGRRCGIEGFAHTYLHTNIHTYIHTYIQTDRQTDKQTNIQTNKQTDKQRYMYIYT